MWIFLSSLSFSANDQNICTTNWCGSSLCLGDNPKDTSTHVCFWPLCPWNIWNKTQPTPWALFLSVGNNQRTSRKALCGFSLSPGLGNSQNPETRYHGFSVSSALWNLKTCLRTINVFFFSLSLCRKWSKVQRNGLMWFLSSCLRDYQNTRCTVLWVLCLFCLGKDQKIILSR